MNLIELSKFFKDIKNFADMNQNNLLTIIKNNEKQEFGITHNFKNITSVEEYQREVPLSQYEDYPKGNKSTYSTMYTLLTSGTSGKSKTILLTNEVLKRYGSLLIDMPIYLQNCPAGPSLHTGVFHRRKTNTILSCAYYSYLKDTHKLKLENYVDGKVLFSSATYCSAYVKLRFALACATLVSIQSIYLYEIVALLSYLERNWKLLFKDMEKNICSIVLPKSIVEELKKLPIDSKRLKFLKFQFYKNNGITPLRTIWPNLAYISGIGRPHDTCVLKLKDYLEDIPIYYFAYASSECMCGIATQMNDDTYLLLPQTAFYEFLDDAKNAYLPHEVIKGKSYELVITTFNGLYRYRTGDQLEIVDTIDGIPRFKVLGRKNLQLNITGERVDEWTIRQALFETFRHLNQKSSYFVIAETKREFPFRYVALTDLPSELLSSAARLFDQQLQLLNHNYKEVRRRKLIAVPQFLYKKNTYVQKEKLQQKPKLILKEDELFSLRSMEETYV